MIDLHTHSSASDGSLAPSRLMALAAERGLSAIALTDHDTLAGIPEAAAEAAALGLRLVRGVEIEVDFSPGEFHLLGLDLPESVPELEKALDGLALKREERNRAILDELAAAGYPVSYDELLAQAGSAMIGRPHIAALLASKRIIRTRQQAFDRFIGKGRPFYRPKAAIQLEEAVELIHASGGLAIVAHPMSLFVSWKHLKELFPAWKEIGLDGIEAWHPTARRSECVRLEAMARDLGFRVTAGSDFHGDLRPERRLGMYAPGMPIQDSYLHALERHPGIPEGDS